MSRHNAGLISAPFSLRVGERFFSFNPINQNPDEAPPGTLPGQRYIKKIERYGPTWGAQFFVGLSVKGVPRFRAEDIRDYVANMRNTQLSLMVRDGRLAPDAEHGGSVLPQLGWWNKVGKEGNEQSVSVIIDNYGTETIDTNTKGQLEGEFVQHMLKIAEQLALDFEQDAVFVRFFFAGTVKEVHSVETGIKT